MVSERERHARALFDGIADAYDRPAEILSFGRYRSWRRALGEALMLPPGSRVLDVATGTGAIAALLEQRHAADVIGLDQSPGMLGSSRVRAVRPLVGASADGIPFPDASFDAVTFSYLLRYTRDPAATLHELARVVRPGGLVGSVEFGIPHRWWARWGWRLYARGIFPLLCRILGPGWREVGSFLPGSIEAWAQTWPLPRQEAAWRDAGVVGVRARALTFGAAVVMVGRKDGHPA